MYHRRRTLFITIAFLSLLLVAVVVMCFHFSSSQNQPPRFVYRNSVIEIELEAYYSQNDSTYYIFLPSCAQNGSLFLKSNKVELSVDGKTYVEGEKMAELVIGKTYPITLMHGHESESSKLCVIKSENVPMMDIRISDKVLEHIVQDRDYQGYATMSLYASDGHVLHSGEGNPIQLKSRGNSTWWNPKKPFLLTLDSPDTLLGMAPGRKWVMLANALDPSNLRNKVVLDFASTLDMQWNSSCEFVDLYINGRYNGLYLVTEKVELGNTRLNPEGNPQYLLLNDIKETVKKSGNPYFPFTGDQWVGLMGCVTDDEIPLDSLAVNLERLKTILSSGNASEEVLMKMVDIDSWVCKYLTDELFLNGDIWRRSNFFYCTGAPPFKFYGGPVWDYDLCMGSGTEEILIMSEKLVPLQTMYSSQTFQYRVDSLYAHLGRPYMMWLQEQGIDSLAQSISAAARANALRWREEGAPNVESDNEATPVDSLKSYIERRMPVLDEFFLGQGLMQFCAYESTDPGLRGFFSTVVYRPGYRLIDYMHCQPDSSLESTRWVDSLTGKYYDIHSVPPPGSCLNIVVPSDILQDTPIAVSRKLIKMSKWLSPIVSTAIFALLLLLIGVREIKQWHNK